jgi:F-type H+-transporting ATPase subunit c
MNCVRKLGLILATLMVTAALVGPALAADGTPTATPKVEEKFAPPMSSPGWGAGLGAGLVILGASLGFGKIGAAALESMARQPETANKVQTAMIIIAALLEGVTFFALVICFVIGQKA